MSICKHVLVAPLMIGVLLANTVAGQAAQRVTATIDLSEQRLYLYVDGRLRSKWAVSTARKGYRTPTGSWRPTRLERDWHSRKYNWAPMPYSVFFYGGYAIHGTTDLKRLGRPASHGCIRLHPKHAAHLFNLVRQVGRRNARVIIRK
ncbi:L,D-transpeptidase [Labrenzia sp. VG12]|uniref:L,D-transpeptidase n=1 Tax=Labrenzia sp. VG12 TaxID=2021862 RepID=UPI000B8C18A2|nr:L,D-transpeptidase [Labrenzia sp. VG12]ASP33709.1 hypothetical protein CHH27_11000 [Labrenzia sp. VG12]